MLLAIFLAAELNPFYLKVSGSVPLVIISRTGAEFIYLFIVFLGCFGVTLDIGRAFSG